MSPDEPEDRQDGETHNQCEDEYDFQGSHIFDFCENAKMARTPTTMRM